MVTPTQNIFIILQESIIEIFTGPIYFEHLDWPLKGFGPAMTTSSPSISLVRYQ
jgi:hypothetical protein